MNRLNIAFIWHMHQPLYKDRLSNTYLMPWVRLHGIKDYLDMALILEHFPNLHQTFNLVPSLVEQIEDYSTGHASDPYWELSKIPVSSLSNAQKAKILEIFFDLNWERMIYKFPRYLEIARKREYLKKRTQNDFDAIVPYFTEQEILDLTVWFNLSWFDYIWQKQEKELADLIEKGRDFTEEDREVVLNKQIEIIKMIIPKYRELVKKGTLELTTTPYYHPILPLLCDSDSASVARPHLHLPHYQYKYPKDAEMQIKKGIKKHIECFGEAPKGLWPSEQSVSPEILPYIAKNDIKWIVSDEGILFNSIGYFPHRDREQILNDPTVLYQPYILEESGREVCIVFRDIYLSDAIGFIYAKMDPYHAARDLYSRLKAIQYRLPDNYPYLVTIALDGENCWENYKNDGYDFLTMFYEMVSEDSDLNMTTVSSYLEEHPPRRVLKNLFSGSWIGSDFTTWIGENAKNKAWDYLFIARNELEDFEKNNSDKKKILEKAWEEIYIAEGSDWFWWFGEGHSSSHDDLFDWQFRLHLQNVYKLISMPVPDYLKYPLYNVGKSTLIPPSVFRDGWVEGHVYDFGARAGTMHQWGKVFGKVYYGKTHNSFRVKVDFSMLYDYSAEDSLEMYIKLEEEKGLCEKEVFNKETKLDTDYSANYKIVSDFNDKNCILFKANEKDEWEEIENISAFKITKDFIDMEFPFSKFPLDKAGNFSFIVAAFKNDIMEEIISDPIEYNLVK